MGDSILQPLHGIFLNDCANTLEMANKRNSHLRKWERNTEKPVFKLIYHKVPSIECQSVDQPNLLFYIHRSLYFD